MSEPYFAVLDTETTGLHRCKPEVRNVPASFTNRGSEVCQLGGLLVSKNLVPVKMFCYYCDVVSAGCSKAAMDVHGLSMKTIRERVPGKFLSSVMMTYLPELFFDNVVFVGYNVEFDMDLIAQTLANTIDFTWFKNRDLTKLPKSGRWSFDVSPYYKVGSNYRRLSSFVKQLEPRRREFIEQYNCPQMIETNCPDLFLESWQTTHNSFFDSLNTYLLWQDLLWKKIVS